MDDGSASLFFGGGVEGGSIRFLGGFAGDGDAARYRSRSAPSSPDLASCEVAFSLGFLRRVRLLIGGVRGGDTRMLLATWKEWVGRSSSSSEVAAWFADDVRTSLICLDPE